MSDETVRDRTGRDIVLLDVLWRSKVLQDHPEMAGHRSEVLATLVTPDHVEDDPLPGRERFYRRAAGPSQWLLVVVSFEQQPGRVITALANRKAPRTWTPSPSASDT